MKILLIILTCLIFFNPLLNSQVFEDFCTDVSVFGDPTAQVGGLYKPSQNGSSEYFRALLVFVQFAGDSSMSIPDWTYGSLPNYSNKFVDSAASSSYRNLTVSDYWDKMSFGNFDFIGDIYPNVVTIKSQSYYQNNSKTYSDCNLDVIKYLDSVNFDFKRYDNWKLQNGRFVFISRNADHYLDLIYIMYRNPGFNGWNIPGGIANLGTFPEYTTHDTITIRSSFGLLGSGITCKLYPNQDYFAALGLFTHEFGHYLFGGGHTQHSDLMCGYPYSYRGGTLALSGWERERLGYLAYSTAYQDNFWMTLQDYLTTGQVLKIPIPGSSTKYFLVENHQRLNKYYDQVRQGGESPGLDTTTTRGSGLYIWRIKNGDSYPPDIDVKTANGNWDWVLVDSIAVGGGFPDTMPLSGRSAVNRNTGKSDRNTRNILWRNNWWEKWHDTIPLTKQLELTRNCMGLDSHPFNYGYNTLFTPWSSPSTYLDGTTNVALQVYSQNGTYITVKVFTTYNSCLALAPSRPQNLKVRNNSGFATLTWEPNIEPDMQYSGKYKIYRASTTGAEPSTYGLLATINAYNHYNAVYNWTDPNPAVGNGDLKLFYKISAVDNNNLESDRSDYDWVPWDGNWQKEISDRSEFNYAIYQNFPNPFNPTTKINYQVKETGMVSLKVYTVLGSQVCSLVSKVQEPGEYSVDFDGSKLPSGIYIYRFKSNGFTKTLKMTLIK